jgi:hypothetical protein
MYDPAGEIEQLMDEKVVFTSREKRKLAITKSLDCEYLGEVVVRQWLKRGDTLAAHQIINRAIPSLIELLFLANDEFPPYDKWLANYSYSLIWKPENWKKRLESLLIVKDFSSSEVDRRYRELGALYGEIWKKIVGEKRSRFNFFEIELANALQYIIENSPVSLVEFKKAGYEASLLSREPICKVASVITRNGEEWIEFDDRAFSKARKDGFRDFLSWNKEMLKMLAESQNERKEEAER